VVEVFLDVFLLFFFEGMFHRLREVDDDR
jgi:hypothetical protein